MGASLLTWRRKDFILMLSLFALLGVFGLSAGLGASAFDYQELNHQANLVVDSHKLQPKLVSYNDDNFLITLYPNDIDNYIWSNLADYILDVGNDYFLDGASIIYGNSSSGDDESDVENEDGDISFYITFGDGSLLLLPLNYDVPKFSLSGTINQFDSIELNISSVDYSTLKAVFELDVRANTAFDGGAVATDIVETLVGGIAGIASGLGAGVSALVSDIFISNGTLSVFGYIVVIFAGIALAIGLSRWVMNFLTSLGAKK